MGVIRFLLAISVVLIHLGDEAPFHLLGGHAAVQCFYVISGFYMALVLNEKYIGDKGGYGLFIGNRLLRLFPSYLVLVVIAIATQIAFRFVQGPRNDELGHWIQNWDRMSGVTRAVLGLPNFILFGLDAGLFLNFVPENGFMTWSSRFSDFGGRFYHFIPQAWSLSVELWFYLLAPLIVRRSGRFIAMVLLASVAARLFTAVVLGWYRDPWMYRFFPFELAFFMAGALGYKLYARLRMRKLDLHRASTAALTVILLLIVGYPMLIGGRSATTLSMLKVDAVLYPLFALSVPLIFMLTKSVKWDRYVGELSYPIYISHLLVITTLEGVRWPVVWAVPLTVMVSVLLFQFVDGPVEQFRHRLTSRPRAVEEPVATLVAPGA